MNDTGLMRSEKFPIKADTESKTPFHEDRDAREEADRLLFDLASLIRNRCPCIDIRYPKRSGKDDLREGDDLAYEVRSESEFSVAEYRLMQYYDWDFLSPRGEELPATQIDQCRIRTPSSRNHSSNEEL